MINDWVVEKKNIDELVDLCDSDRFIKDSNFDGLKSSIKRFGNVEFPVWNKRTGNLISGRQKIKALKELGETQIDVIVVDFDEVEESLADKTLNNTEISGTYTEGALELAKTVQLDDPKLAKALNFGSLIKDIEKLLPKVEPEMLDAKIPDPDFDMVCPCCGEKWCLKSEDVIMEGDKNDSPVENKEQYDIN